MKKFLNEFKAFLMKGNALDLAIGIIIGGAFGGVVNSLVNDLLMPPLGLLLGRVNFSDLYVQLNPSAVPLEAYTPLAAALEKGAVVFAYGKFLTTLLNFVIIGLAVFMLVKVMRKAEERAFGKATEQPATTTTKPCPFCATEIPMQATRCPHCTSQLE